VPRIDNESLATKPSAYLLVKANSATIDNVVNDVGDVVTTTSTPMVLENATNTPPSSLFDDANLYDDSDDDNLVTLLISLHSESALISGSHVPLRVPRLQAQPRIRSPVYNHYITTLLDTYYTSKSTKKHTQDHQHKCKKCAFTTLDSQRNRTANMIKHIKKHSVFLLSLLVLSS